MTDRKHKKHDEAPVSAMAAEAGGEATPPPAESAGAPAAATTSEDPAALAAERDEYLDHLRRLKAEFENYRKRVQRDHEELRLRAAETVVESLLPVMDNMGRALVAGGCDDGGQLLAGFQLVADQLRGTLEAHGLAEIPAEPGTPFDPTFHEAIMTQPSEEYPEGSVLQVLERGYLLHGRLLRPTKVIVVS